MYAPRLTTCVAASARVAPEAPAVRSAMRSMVAMPCSAAMTSTRQYWAVPRSALKKRTYGLH